MNDIFRKHPKDHITKLEELGFKYFEDDDDDSEEIEEWNAKPENQRQSYLVAYFENKNKISKKIFENILSILISYYTRACVDQQNLETFTELAKDFYYATRPDGYEALFALLELFEPHTDKRKIIDFLISEEEEIDRQSSQPIEF